MPAPNPELLRSLGRLVRGLSALFWGLPLALVVCFGTATGGWFGDFAPVPLLCATGLLLFGLLQLYAFQKQERPWRKALDRSAFLALVNLGLSPFLFFWHYVPASSFFGLMVGLFTLAALLFLFFLNIVIVRLGAMLPDETLRLETRHYTALNRTLLIALLTIVSTYLVLTRVVFHYFPQIPHLPEHVNLLSLQIAIPALGLEISSLWFVLLLTCVLLLLPLSMTMALIWKTKEVILENVFGMAG